MTVVNRRLTLLLLLSASSSIVSCREFEDWLFRRNSPTVDRAIRALETKDAGDANQLLSEYLSTGRCKGGIIGTPDSVRERPNASVDLGLTLFQLAERFGEKFGEPPPASEEERAAKGPELAKRSQEVDCALRLVRLIAQDESVATELRAQAYYLSGNLDFLRHDYASAVKSYDSALELIPGGMPDAGDDVGARAAYNRAIALVRAEQQKQDPPPRPDAGTPPPSDAGGSPDDESDPGDSKPEHQQKQDPKEQQDQQDQQDEPDQREENGQSSQDQPQDEQNAPGSASAPPSQPAAPSASAPTAGRPSLSQDEQILEMLERAPMIQQELPKARVRGVGRASMEDK